MLTSARQASSYRSVASAVNTRLVDMRVNGQPTRRPDDLAKERIDTVRDLLAVGRRYARGRNELDTYGSSPAKLDLARELVQLVPAVIEPYKSELNMRDWASQAIRVLDAVKDGKSLDELGADAEFAEHELEPFLRRILALPPPEPDW